MKKVIFITLVSLFAVIGVYSANDSKSLSPKQLEKARLANIKKELDSAKDNIKSGKNLDKSVVSLNKLLRDSLSHNDIRLHNMLLDVVRKQYAQGNEALFLRQKYDTASIYTLCQQMFLVANSLDSVDAMPDAKGKVSLKYRKDNSEELSHIVQNLYGGVVFFVNKQKYAEAQSLADTYLNVQQWHLFNGRDLGIDSLHQRHTACMYLLSAWKQNKFSDVLKYDSLALLYTKRREQCMEAIAKSYYELGDTAQYIYQLELGVDEYPTNTYFFPHLVDYYCNRKEYDAALAVIDKTVARDSLNEVALVARQTILFNLGKYDECIALGKQIDSLNDSIPEVVLNIAMSYWYSSEKIDKTKLKLKDYTKKVNAVYRECLPYMERYRKLCPKDKEHWKPVLYTIYLNLNLGKKFAEIEDE